jgi:hypothetical protein
MEELSGNPTSNRLPPGIGEDELLGAVAKSGYPLQTVIARILAGKDWSVTEEWSYFDSDTGDPRTLDVRGRRRLQSQEQSNERAFHPSLDLLIECKQSDLPYVFFGAASPAIVETFPRLVGLPLQVNLQGDTPGLHWSVSALRALGGTDESFVASPPAVASSFARAERAGKNIRLSGEETYRGLVEPILKATEYYASRHRYNPPDTALQCRVTAPLAVLDAPMVLVETHGEAPELQYAPWVRVLRHESPPADRRNTWRAERLLALDAVHRDFLEPYLGTNLEPFTRELVSRLNALRHLILGRDLYVFGLERGSGLPGRLDQRLRPLSE